MKTEWARERCERVARRRRQVMEAVTAMRLSVRVEPFQTFNHSNSNICEDSKRNKFREQTHSNIQTYEAFEELKRNLFKQLSVTQRICGFCVRFRSECVWASCGKTTARQGEARGDRGPILRRPPGMRKRLFCAAVLY
jgi:hypothetical protein